MFLLSDEADYVTAAALDIDGGPVDDGNEPHAGPQVELVSEVRMPMWPSKDWP